MNLFIDPRALPTGSKSTEKHKTYIPFDDVTEGGTGSDPKTPLSLKNATVYVQNKTAEAVIPIPRASGGVPPYQLSLYGIVPLLVSFVSTRPENFMKSPSPPHTHTHGCVCVHIRVIVRFRIIPSSAHSVGEEMGEEK